MLSNVPRSSRAGGLQVRALTNPAKASHYGQTRGFRFRAWSTYLDPDFQRQLRQHQRNVTYKYMESINRKISWDPSSRGEDSRILMKKMMAQCWIRHGHTHSKGSRDPSDKASAEPGVRPGQNIEDVERGAINALFSSKRTGPYEYDLWQSPLQNIRNYLGSQTRGKSTTSASRGAESEIDPITNRRVSPDSAVESSSAAANEPFYEDGPPPPEELKQYGQVPLDGTPWADSGDAGAPQYSDLDKYKPVMDEKLDAGQQKPAESEYDDLHKYTPVGLKDFIKDDEAGQPKYEDLHKYSNPSLADGPPEELSHPAYEDLDKYRPVMHNEDAEVPEAQERYSDLNKYGPVMHNEDKDAKDTLSYDDLHKPVQYDEPEGQRPKPEWDQTAFDEAKKYESYRHNEPDGQPIEVIDPVSKGLSDFDAEIAAKASRTTAAATAATAAGATTGTTGASKRLLTTSATDQERADDLDLLRASDIRAKIPISSGQSRRGYSTTNRQMLEADLPRYEVNWDISSKAARVSLRKAKSRAWENIQPKEDLTGNYVRDFPEDFSRSWTNIVAGSSKAEDSKYQSPQGDDVEAASFDESFPKLEPALNRASAFKSQRAAGRQGLPDMYSTEPQGLELSYSEECGGKQTWPSYVRSYGTTSDAAADAAASESVSTSAKEELREPVVYKILAYDPTMQTINTAETTSVVPDSATPLTPAEVLLRLSNPTKFFPYFSPLQKEGYEIVSGSGDVLVFRKVREAEVTPFTPTIEKPTTYQAPKVNPIDMMGSDPVVPSAYSSSPTGYLNYDYPGAEAEDKPPPPFSAVRRRNTISCDRQDFEAPRRPKKRRARKILLGAAWVGGISYAIGVVGEYFKTGGEDGRGPKGL
ncbi:hypothetical protein K4K49_011394 [Colletotrichum sp. SAR 10_70]|nr:hypothetical protein K4K50_011410 [Colletotrichum sp. SAR 10_71]KAI8151457.1 hypothetical protein K4K49_011394 [Colletotrichum sp. SAR 10_70]KAI8151888.1 hypothetical protein KHU50_011916 [Colletotrichum sp. SAR 10_65]KAI8196128.1 hypothetical protein K4K52_011667 [Colletotrichum sp. SAR 10_76]KAI8211949.1 hypothetical protein K4K53_011837 [Colletotrichum sp. SAR 10_77]KAI8216833.1 hypothetical protein K4K54_012393 [Colletotrichum sp. SAR 10_86]KAJ4994792.1 hypothetical protein K4K48_01194